LSTGIIDGERISHVHLRVRDLARSAAFYRELLGLHARAVDESTGGVWVCESPAGGFRIALTQGLGGPASGGVDHIAIEVDSAADVQRAFQESTARGWRATRPRIYEDHVQTFVFDPDGYKIEILAAGRTAASGFSEASPQLELSVA